MESRFKVAPQVLQETISGEVVIINMMTGDYYSLVETGAEIWEMLIHGCSLAEISDRLEKKYISSPEEIQASLTALVLSLENEGLVSKSDGIAAPDQSLDLSQDLSNNRLAFIPAELNKYNDMQELLLVDPIHDVDESGWPNVSKDVAA